MMLVTPVEQQQFAEAYPSDTLYAHTIDGSLPVVSMNFYDTNATYADPFHAVWY